MKKKTSIVALLVLLVCSSIFAQQYDDESDFRAIPIDNGRSVRIIRYEGEKQIINIPPRMHGKPVTEIGEDVFKGTDITSVTIPRNVAAIGKGAFNGCQNLATISFASGSKLQSIGDGAFIGCGSLTGITIPEGVTNIGERAFVNCFALTSVIIPKGVTTIGNSTFFFCLSLSSVTISEGVTNIGDLAFACCTNLTSITIPKSVISIGNAALGACSGITEITVDAGNPQYTGEGGILWNKAKNKLVAFPSASGAVTIPKGVTSIGDGAFSSCSGLTEIIIPEGITSIGNSAFASCTSLTSVTIPVGVMAVGWNTFMNWTSSQRINVRGHANRAAADRAWGAEWRQNCNAAIVYGR